MGSGVWDYSIFWKETINQIRDEVSEQEFVMWFNNMQYETSAESEILVRVPSSFYKDQIRQRYLTHLEAKLLELSGNNLNSSEQSVGL